MFSSNKLKPDTPDQLHFRDNSDLPPWNFEATEQIKAKLFKLNESSQFQHLKINKEIKNILAYNIYIVN